MNRNETEYAAWSGTSMATPHVTAAAAMVRARNLTLGPQAVAAQLEANARPLGGMSPGVHNTSFGYGLLHLP